MATGIDHLMNSKQTGIGKGRVGGSAAPARRGVIVRVAIFFDGTKNNRANTSS